jgi:hypothetical protein
MPYISDSAITIVRQRVDDDCRAARAVALVANFLVMASIQFTSPTPDGAINIVSRHALRLRFVDGEAQPWIRCNLAATDSGSNRDFLDEFGE